MRYYEIQEVNKYIKTDLSNKMALHNGRHSTSRIRAISSAVKGEFFSLLTACKMYYN